MAGGGNLDRRITVQRYTTTTNDFNEEVMSWDDLTTVWASREDVSDSEKVAAGQVGSALRSRFVDRLSYDDADWNIVGIKETKDGRERYREITAVRDSD